MFAVTPVVPPGTRTYEGEPEPLSPLTIARVAPLDIVMVGAEPPGAATETDEPEVAPVAPVTADAAHENEFPLCSEDERLQVSIRFLTVPFIIVNELSRLMVIAAGEVLAVPVSVLPLKTREPVLRAFVPSQSWQELRLAIVPPVVVSENGTDERRTSSPTEKHQLYSREVDVVAARYDALRGRSSAVALSESCGLYRHRVHREVTYARSDCVAGSITGNVCPVRRRIGVGLNSDARATPEAT